MNNLFNLKGKVALITGGNGGLGLAMAEGLAQAGSDIIIAARDQGKTAEAVSALKAHGIHAEGITVDVTQESQIRDKVSKSIDIFSKIDVLINNAGTTVRKEPQDLSIEEWDLVIDVNLRAAFLSSKEVYPHMKKEGGGKIINIGSMFSLFGGGGSGAPYSSSKGGLVQLSKSLAVALAKDNIQSNTILPGWFMTELTKAIPTTQPDRYELISKRIPVGRWGDPDELQGAAIFLSSKASDYITGAVLTVDGGYSVM